MCDVPISVAFGEKKKDKKKIHNLTITAGRQRFDIPDCTRDSNDFGKHCILKTKQFCIPLAEILSTYFPARSDSRRDCDITELSSAPLRHSGLNGAKTDEQFSNNSSSQSCRLFFPI